MDKNFFLSPNFRKNYKSLLFFSVLTTIVFLTFFSISISKLLQNNVFTESKALSNNSNDITNSKQNAITKAISKTRDAVVGINVIELQEVINNPFANDPFFNFFAPYTSRKTTRKVQGLGSGFIISEDGYILTNHHVAGNAKKIIVTLTDGSKYNAELIGSDMVSDIALLKIEADKLPFIKLADSDDLLIGEWAIAMGNPFGLFDINSKPTVTVGVVSNLGINFLNEDRPFNRVYKKMIQTDAAISSGNSGGPLLNSNGDAIGMNTIIYSTAQNRDGAGSIGIGFAIPINRVKEIVTELQEKGKIERAVYSGLEVDNIDENYVSNYNLPDEFGVIITRIYRNSPAEKADLEPADVIRSINGAPIYHSNDFLVEILDGRIGEEFKLEIFREGKILKKTLILENARR